MQSHPVQTCSELLRKIRSSHVLDESLLEGIKQHSLQSLFSHFVFQTEQSFSLQQLLMAARNNYGTGHWNRKEAKSLPVFSMFFLLYTQLRKRITWVGRHSAHKKVSEKCMGRLDRRKEEGENCWEKCGKILISTTNSNLVLLSTTTSHKNLEQDMQLSIFKIPLL